MSEGIFVFCDRKPPAGHKGRVPIEDFPADKPNWGLRMAEPPIIGKASGMTIHPIHKLTLYCPRCGFSVRADETNLANVLNQLAAEGETRVSLKDLATRLRRG
ncbi:hypothetical protein ABVK33_10025 [Mycobacterium kansasii]|uniref:hypothetical protein n=1 Tax=Mycobacterium kansasii TaxID=1768 RepID=UPI000F039BD4|nr:hypothetical protein [Mycobacterium kansasii]VAZ65311.1 hypothetical protein LAUMK40_01436 [Mycobacterium kansasii]